MNHVVNSAFQTLYTPQNDAEGYFEDAWVGQYSFGIKKIQKISSNFYIMI